MIQLGIVHDQQIGTAMIQLGIVQDQQIGTANDTAVS